MNEDQALARAAGIIMHHLHNGKDREYALARAMEREPDLSAADISAAEDWANAAIQFAVVASVAPPTMTVAEMLRAAGVPGW